MKKVLSVLLCIALCFTMLVGCGGTTNGDKDSDTKAETKAETQSAETKEADVATEADVETEADNGIDMSEKVKIGVLVADVTTAEALAFRSYYTQYIQNQYNVEFVYSDALKDSADEKSAIDTFITNNCKAIISFSSFDRMAQIDQCAKAKVYYAVATGTLTDEEYEKVKTNEYYVGAIGPSLDIEYQTGYDMAKYYLDKGVKNFAIFGGAVPYYTDMHIYRVAGMLAAMADATGADYQGAKGPAIVGKIYETADVKTGSIGDVNILGYVGGYDMDDAWFGKIAEVAQTSGLEMILAVGNGSDFFGTAVNGTDVKIASVDAYADSYGAAMDAGILDYMAGKFSASIGPIFAITYSAALGAPIRDNDGNAVALGQGYWVATSPEQFKEYYSVDNSLDAPAYDKADLDTLIGSDYATLEKFVAAYTFDEIK